MSEQPRRHDLLRPTAFKALVQSLPDEIERARDDGLPIVMPDPGTEHGRRLYRALGVEIEGERDE